MYWLRPIECFDEVIGYFRCCRIPFKSITVLIECLVAETEDVIVHLADTFNNQNFQSM